MATSAPIQCVYCGTPQNPTPSRRSPRSLLRRMLYTPSRETTSSFAITCTCGQTYNLIMIGDREYWRTNIVPHEGVLEDIKRLLHDESITFDTIINSMIGIAKFENGTVHVCFIICNIRGYFDCIENYPIITLITVWKMREST